jgi:hypothetical protein
MKITTKAKAESLMVDSLFSPDGTLERGKFDSGKYRGKPSDYIGRDVPQFSDVIAVYPISRADRSGKYVQLMSLSKPN